MDHDPRRCPPRHASPPPLRLFIALWPDAATRRALSAWQDRWRWPAAARCVPAQRLHMTLHFLGPVAAERVPEVREALATAAADFAPFELRFGEARLWPHGLAVLGPRPGDAGLQPLAHWHARLAEMLRQLQLPVEARPFRPHVTLARRAAGALPPPRSPRFGWAVRGCALVQSADGYRVLQRYP